MTVTTTEETAPATADDQDGPKPAAATTAPLVAGDLLVEDVSIDGMCGVY
ncbi:MAG: mycofactocin precursor MftA [Acidimicrobiales bacterium]|jgi:mycofactocin precursor